MKHKLISLAAMIACFCATAMAQNVALKTNVIDDALTDINLGIEVGVAPRWSVDLTGSFNAWKFSEGKRWKHWYAQPEARYWMCDRMDGHFIGFHAFGGQYNVGGIKHLTKFLGTDFSKLADSRYQGWFVGAGVAYGYAWPVTKHFNIEAEIGVGWAYTRYDRFQCTGCGKKVESNHPHNYVGPTKAALNLVYVF